MHIRRGADRLPLGLWWSAETVRDLCQGDAIHRFADWLGEHGFSVATLNCFPYGGFHDAQVKRGVFRPGWHEAERREYTVRAARLLANFVARVWELQPRRGTHFFRVHV